MGKIDWFMRHTWLYLYSTRTMGATVLSQEEKNLREGSEHSINVIMTSDNSQMTLRWLQDDSSEDYKHFMGLCDWSHCATSPNVPVAEVLNSELPHLVSEIQTQPLWLKPISTTEWLKLRHFWMYSCQITWNISSRCIVRCPRILNNIIKAKGVCRTTFGKKIRISWVCQYIIRVLKAILWS